MNEERGQNKLHRQNLTRREVLKLGGAVLGEYLLARCSPAPTSVIESTLPFTDILVPPTSTPTRVPPTSTTVPSTATPEATLTSTQTEIPSPTAEPTLSIEEKLDILKRVGFTKESWEKQSKEKLGSLADEVIYPISEKRGKLKPIDIINNADITSHFRWSYDENGKQIVNDDIWRITGIVSQSPYIDEESGELFAKIKTLDKNGNEIDLNVSFWKPEGWGGQTMRGTFPLGDMDALRFMISVKYPQRILKDLKKGMMVMVDLPDKRYKLPDMIIEDICKSIPDYCQQWTEYYGERQNEVFPKYLAITEETTENILNGNSKAVKDQRIWIMNVMYSTGW